MFISSDISILLENWRYVLQLNLLPLVSTTEISEIVILFTNFFPPFSQVLRDRRLFFERSVVHWPFSTCSAFNAWDSPCRRYTQVIYELCTFWTNVFWHNIWNEVFRLHIWHWGDIRYHGTSEQRDWNWVGTENVATEHFQLSAACMWHNLLSCYRFALWPWNTMISLTSPRAWEVSTAISFSIFQS